MTHTRSDGAEQVPSVNSDQAALLVGKVPPRGSSRAGSSEGIGADAETSPDTERNARRLKSKSPRAEASTKKGATPTRCSDALEDKARDPERVHLWTTPTSTGDDTTDADPHAAGAPCISDPGGDQYAAGNARAQPVSLHSLPIQPGGVMIPLGSQDRRTTGCAIADTAPSNVGVLKETKNRPSHPDGTAEEHGSASAQAVKRGHQVAIIEVPDEDDDTAYQRWLAKGSPIVTPTRPVATLPMPPDSPIQIGRTYTDGQTYQDWQTQGKVTSPTVVAPSTANAKVPEVPRQGWMKPLSVDWTLRNVQEARSDNAARAQLVLWMHKDRLGELTDELLEELRIGGRTAVERLYELREPIRYIRGASGDFSIPVTIEPVSSLLKLTTKALIDSGCTGSAINQAYVEEHGLDTKKVLIPIPVYNADGTRNQGGDIMEFVELSLTIGEHHKRIDLAVMNLGKKDIYLGHDWLKRHNPSVNWERGNRYLWLLSLHGRTARPPG